MQRDMRERLFWLSVALLVLTHGALAEMRPLFSAMSVSELKVFLEDKNASCLACSEKADFLARAEEVWILRNSEPGRSSSRPPEEQEEASGRNSTYEREEVSKEEFIALLRKLKKQFPDGKGYEVYERDLPKSSPRNMQELR